MSYSPFDYSPLEEIEKMINETPNDQELGGKIRNFFRGIEILRDIAVKHIEEMITSDKIDDGLYEV